MGWSSSCDAELLLILDNLEQVLDTTAESAETLLKTCPHLRIFATNREPLGVGGNAALRVPPLAAAKLDQEPSLRGLPRYAAVTGEDVWTPRQREIECCQQMLAVTETRGEVLYRSYALRAMAVAIWAAGKSQSRGRATRAVFTTGPEEERILYYRSVSRGFCLGRGSWIGREGSRSTDGRGRGVGAVDG